MERGGVGGFEAVERRVDFDGVGDAVVFPGLDVWWGVWELLVWFVFYVCGI